MITWGAGCIKMGGGVVRTETVTRGWSRPLVSFHVGG